MMLNDTVGQTKRN